MSAGDPIGTQRLDKWLWFARVAKTRTLAADLVAGGKVRVNRLRVDKPGYAVRIGDVITVTAAARIRVLKVVAAGVRRGPPREATALYEELASPIPKSSADQALTDLDTGERAGRPTKRDRRLRRGMTNKA